MPLTACPVCQNPVATTAPTCPKCGAVIKKKSRFSILRIFFMVIAIVGLLLSLANGFLIGIVATAVLLLLVALAN